MKLNTISSEFWTLLPNYNIVALHLGTNHMPLAYDSPEVVQRKYMGVIRKIQEINKNSIVVISGILPRCWNNFSSHQLNKDDRWRENNKKAIITNQLLKNIAEDQRYHMK